MSLHIPPEQLSFSVDPANLPALAQKVAQPADEMQAEAEERAVPADVGMAEEPLEDRVVVSPADHDAVVVDGVQLSMSSSFANVRIGCESLGLSKKTLWQTEMLEESLVNF